MRTKDDLDQMVADHDTRTNGQHDELVGYQTEADPLVRRARILVEMGGDYPRNVWPTHSSRWTEADVAERREWVRELYGRRQLAIPVVAGRLGLNMATISNDVRVMGIGRGRGILGQEGVKERRRKERQVHVRRLFEGEGRSAQDIAELLGVNESTVHNDVRSLGLTRGRPRVSNAKLTQVVDRAVTQLSTMAQLLLDQDGVDALVVEPDRVKEWERQLRVVGRAVARVRRTMKGEP
jgi:hypothetical protein